MRISLHFPQIQEMYSLFMNWSITSVYDPSKLCQGKASSSTVSLTYCCPESGFKSTYYGTFLQKFFRKTTAFCTVFSLALAFCSQPSQSSSSSPENNSKTFKQSTCSCIHPVLTMQVFIIIQKYCYSIIESITLLTYSFYSFDIPIWRSNMCHPIVIFFF